MARGRKVWVSWCSTIMKMAYFKHWHVPLQPFYYYLLLVIFKKYKMESLMIGSSIKRAQGTFVQWKVSTAISFKKNERLNAGLKLIPREEEGQVAAYLPTLMSEAWAIALFPIIFIIIIIFASTCKVKMHGFVSSFHLVFVPDRQSYLQNALLEAAWPFSDCLCVPWHLSRPRAKKSASRLTFRPFLTLLLRKVAWFYATITPPPQQQHHQADDAGSKNFPILWSRIPRINSIVSFDPHQICNIYALFCFHAAAAVETMAVITVIAAEGRSSSLKKFHLFLRVFQVTVARVTAGVLLPGP